MPHLIDSPPRSVLHFLACRNRTIPSVPFLTSNPYPVDRCTRHSIVRSCSTFDRYLINSSTSTFFGQGLRRRRTIRARFATCSRSRKRGDFGPQSGVIPPASAPEPAIPPTRSQLRTLFYHSAVPMIGFGLMDNFVMISAGDLIDNTLGVKFGLATLTAAAYGQVVSDVCGVCFGGTVEALATKLGLPPSDLSMSQRGMRISRLTATFGAAAGVVLGCLIGMGTLLFVDTTAADRLKKQRGVDSLFAAILDDGHSLVGAERCSLFFVDEEKGELWTKVATDRGGEIKTGKMITIPINVGIAGEVVKTKALRNVADISKDRNYFGEVDLAMKTTTRNMLAVPVMSRSHDDKVIAVIEMMNKSGPFDEDDEKLVSMLAAHVSIFIRQLEGGRDYQYEKAEPMQPLTSAQKSP